MYAGWEMRGAEGREGFSLRWTVYSDLGRTWTFLVFATVSYLSVKHRTDSFRMAKQRDSFYSVFFYSLKASSNWEGVGKPFVLMKGRIQKHISANIEKQRQIVCVGEWRDANRSDGGTKWPTLIYANEWDGVRYKKDSYLLCGFWQEKGTDTFPDSYWRGSTRKSNVICGDI